MADIEQQIERRMQLMEWFTKSYAEVDGIVIGVAMMIEYVDQYGERGVHRITSDASGHPLPWYLVEGLARALESLDEFDDEVGGDGD